MYESIAAAAAFRKESGNTTGAASLRGIGDGWADSATVGTNSATDMRVSVETAMQHTRVIARVTVISEPLGKLTIRLVRRLGGGS